ncbi:MAG TPA: PIN domain-containing protein [Nanoarchaeota archaeon]|nr:PIN domain-containing protein [Nanoarchaeota archaeon]
MRLVIDTNIFISALLRDSKVRELIVNSPLPLIFPEAVLYELRKHEGELLEKSGLAKEDYEKIISALLTYAEIVPTEALKAYREEALRIVERIDIDDAIFFAAALANLPAIIWSEDKKLKKQDKVIVLNTAEIIQLFGRLDAKT